MAIWCTAGHTPDERPGVRQNLEQPDGDVLGIRRDQVPSRQIGHGSHPPSKSRNRSLSPMSSFAQDTPHLAGYCCDGTGRAATLIGAPMPTLKS